MFCAFVPFGAECLSSWGWYVKGRDKGRKGVRKGGGEIKVLVLCVGSTQHGSVKVWGVLGSRGWHISAGGERRVYEFCDDALCSKKPILYYQVFENYEKFEEIQAYICTQDRFKGVLYPRRIPSLFSPIGFLGKTPGKMHLLSQLKNSHVRTALWRALTMGGTSSSRNMWQNSKLPFYFSSREQINSLVLKYWEDRNYCVRACMCLTVPWEPWERLLGVCSWKITCSSPLCGQAVPAQPLGPGYLLPARCLLCLLPLPTWFQLIPDETHYIWTWQLVHQPCWACRIWPQSKGNPMWWQWAEQINHACQTRVGSGSVSQSPKKSSFLWSSSQVSGYLSEMAASTACSSLPLLGTAERFVEGLQQVCECGPGCLVCQGGTSQQKAQPFCQGKLGNLYLWVARERRYLLVWG